MDSESRVNRLKEVTLLNLTNLQKILEYNVQNNIHFYRITSSLYPLGTHPEVLDWSHRQYTKPVLFKIGQYVKRHNLRVDTHIDQFCVLNSINENVVESTTRELWQHVNMWEDMGYPEGRMVLHIGGATHGKQEGIIRFINNFNKLPSGLSSKLILENDDKTFNAEDVLYICETVKVPMVFDMHHYTINRCEKSVDQLLPQIFKTWDGTGLRPKLHYSTPKSHPMDRNHSEYINGSELLDFINLTKDCINQDYDIMLESKGKDLALFKLIEDIKILKPNIKWVDNTTIEI
jgi:UV DNA damage endonuclease